MYPRSIFRFYRPVSFPYSQRLPYPSSTKQTDPIDAAKDVDVGFIFNQREAERKARQYMAENPGWEWNGHWTTRGDTSVIGVRQVAAEQEVRFWCAPPSTPDERSLIFVAHCR